MAFLILLFKGIVIGLGKIIPGVSGSIIAISLNVYEKALYYINNLIKQKKEALLFLLPLSIGIFLSIIFGSKIILFFLDNYYLPTMLLFIGLILGGTKSIIKNIEKFNIICFLISFIFLFGILLLGGSNNVEITNSFQQIFLYFIIGIIEVLTTIVPGISGTAIFMSLGLYEILMEMLSSLTCISCIWANIARISPYIIGVILGLGMFIKLISFLLNRYRNETYSCIIGFSLSAIISMFIDTLENNYSLINVISGIILLMLGYCVSKKLF